MDSILLECVRQAMAQPLQLLSNDDRVDIFDMLKEDYAQAFLKTAQVIQPLQLYYRGMVAGIEAERARRDNMRLTLSQQPLSSKVKLLGADEEMKKEL